jgi:hypothetical protein
MNVMLFRLLKCVSLPELLATASDPPPLISCMLCRLYKFEYDTDLRLMNVILKERCTNISYHTVNG